MNILESILLAFESVRDSKLRSGLTLLSIAIGIFAIIGSGTAITSLNNTVSTQLAEMGDNVFVIQKFPPVMDGETWRKLRSRKSITYSLARRFKSEFTASANNIEAVGIEFNTSGEVVKNGNLHTDPNIKLVGADEGYFATTNITIDEGRHFNSEDVSLNRRIVVIGADIVNKLFPFGSPLGKTISIRKQPFVVIGILKPRGAALGQSQDNQVILPLPYVMQHFTGERQNSVALSVKVSEKKHISDAMDESIGLMRSLRGDQPWLDNSFDVYTNENISQQFESLTQYINFFGVGAGLVALIVAGVGIMNIMLVSVKERTREIGIRKAIGAKRRWILSQFLIESVALCQLGGLIGITLGLIGGAALSSWIGGSVIVPVGWIAFSVGICTLLGMMFGAYPAWKAAGLDPIEALRYE